MQDNPAMHLVIDHAAPPGPQCQSALATLQLPSLASLLKRMALAQRLSGTAQDLSPLSERVQAQALGGADGLIPWAAADAQRLGLLRESQTTSDSSGWARITPCHWKVNTDHVEMLDPAELALSMEETAALMEAMRGYFAEDGITLYPYPSSAGTWLAHGAVFQGLATASLERVRGARMDTWMPRQPQAKTLRRLQNEMQMLLYTHPLNDARTDRRQTTVNSFWVSGTGELPSGYNGAANSAAPTINASLRAAALRDDAAGWVDRWCALDTTLLAGADASVLTLTLCGERQAITFAPTTGGWLARLRQRLKAPTPSQLLSTL